MYPLEHVIYWLLLDAGIEEISKTDILASRIKLIADLLSLWWSAIAEITDCWRLLVFYLNIICDAQSTIGIPFMTAVITKATVVASGPQVILRL